MKDFIESLGARRSRKDGPRKPLRTLKEMAEEFGVTVNSLRALIGHHDGPKPVLKHDCTVRNTWYDPAVLRAWWKQIKGGKT